MKFNHIIVFIITCLCWNYSFSQEDARPLIEKGNSFYEKKDFRNAAIQYKHACQLDTVSFDAWYNFGNALTQLQKPILATDAYRKAMTLANDKKLKSNILHNIGNIECTKENYQSAIEFYKQALILNPTDDDTRYNLAFAQNALKQQEKDKKDNEQNKDKEKEQPKPSKFAEECLKKSQEFLAKYQFQEALNVMQEGIKKDKTVELFHEYTQKLEGIVSIQEENK